MLRFVADQNLTGAITRGLLRIQPKLALVRTQDVGLGHAEDPQLLEWAANERRIILTPDVRTLRKFAEDRVRVGQKMPGVFLVGNHATVGQAIEDLLLLAECSREDEWEGKIVFIPL